MFTARYGLFLYNSVNFRPYSAIEYCQQYATAARTAAIATNNTHTAILLPLTQFGFHKHYVFSLQRNAKLFKLHLERNATKFRRIFISLISRPLCVTTCRRSTCSKWHIAVSNNAHAQRPTFQTFPTHSRPVTLTLSTPCTLYQPLMCTVCRQNAVSIPTNQMPLRSCYLQVQTSAASV